MQVVQPADAAVDAAAQPRDLGALRARAAVADERQRDGPARRPAARSSARASAAVRRSGDDAVDDRQRQRQPELVVERVAQLRASR